MNCYACALDNIFPADYLILLYYSVSYYIYPFVHLYSVAYYVSYRSHVEWQIIKRTELMCMYCNIIFICHKIYYISKAFLISVYIYGVNSKRFVIPVDDQLKGQSHKKVCGKGGWEKFNIDSYWSLNFAGRRLNF
jgi:hypothetical protein